MSALAMGRLSDRKGPVGRGSQLAMKLAPRHYFYDRCNEILAEAEFDETVEMLCQPYYEDDGRLSVPPGRYFRMLFVGQFEGLELEREIEWRCADSLSLHRFLRLVEGERVPDHSTLSVTRSRLPLESTMPCSASSWRSRTSMTWCPLAGLASMPRPSKPMLRCAVWCAGTRARITRRCCGAWRGRAASRRRPRPS